MRLPDERLPVIVGIGECTDRTRNPAEALEPVELMAQALRAAAQDCGHDVLAQVERLDVVCEYSWPYSSAPDLLAARLGIAPRVRRYGEVGGESPVRYLHEAAAQIAAGHCQLAALVGAEAQYAVERAKKEGAALPWTPRDDSVRLVRGPDFLHPVAVAHGAATPAHVYPFFENATHVAWGQDVAEAARESGLIWSRMSQVAAGQPHAWTPQARSAEEILTPTPQNRRVAWPYTKFMVANPQVNMGAAVLVCSLAFARRLGVPDSRLVHVWCGTAAKEPRDYLQREGFTRSPAQEAVLRGVMRRAGLETGRLAAAELYSCFPVVPKMARRILGLPADAQLSTIGGLSFFGAPLNNYMTHAVCGAVRQLRQCQDGHALLYGQGEYVTKHHALVLGNRAPSTPLVLADPSVQAEAEALRKPAPEFAPHYTGPAELETFTVLYSRQGGGRGVVIARTADGRRIMARVAETDRATLRALEDPRTTPVGRTGQVTEDGVGLLDWRCA